MTCFPISIQSPIGHELNGPQTAESSLLIELLIAAIETAGALFNGLKTLIAYFVA